MSKLAQAKTRIVDLFNIGVMLQSDIGEFLSITSTVFAQYPKLLYREKLYLNGLYDGLALATFKERHVHGGFYEGRFYSTRSDRLDYYGKAGISAPSWAALATRKGFYWLDENGKCNGSKPYYVGEKK